MLAGMTLVGSGALAVLTLGLVFAVTAAPRVVLAAKTAALQQTLASTPPLEHTLNVTTTWSNATGAFGEPANSSSAVLSAGQLTDIGTQLHADYDRAPVTLSPATATWAGLTTSQLQTVLSGAHPANRARVLLEIGYRQPLAPYLRVLAGHLPTQAPVAEKLSFKQRFGRVTVTLGSGAIYYPHLQIVVTTQTARQFGLHPGSTVVVKGPEVTFGPPPPPITLEVTGIAAPRDPAANFWTTDETMVQPGMECQSCSSPFWAAGVFVGQAELTALQRDFGQQGIAIGWQFPLLTGSTNWPRAAPLWSALSRLGAQVPKLTGDMAPVASTLTASSALLQPLRGAIATAQATDTLLWIMYVSLGVAGLVVLALAARMVVLRRSTELAVRRARGASARQLAQAVAGGAALACAPAAALGALLAVLLTTGPEPPGGWWPPAVVLAASVIVPGLLAAWQHRLPQYQLAQLRLAQGRPAVARQPRAARSRAAGSRVRLVIEITAAAASVAGLVVFRQHGVAGSGAGPVLGGTVLGGTVSGGTALGGTVLAGTGPPGTGAGIDLYTSAAPVLIAIPAVIVVLRLYPLVLRALLRGYARGSGATVFLGLARAARTRLTPALPAFALVLALSVAAFAGLVRDAVINSEVAASWRAAGADVSITATTQLTGNPTASITPQAQRAAAALPGVTHAAAVWQSSWQTAFGQQVTVIAVDPVAYAALVADTEGYPRISAGLLTAPASQGNTAPSGGGNATPVLASPQGASDLSGAAGLDTLTSGAGVAPVRVRLAGTVSATPALPGGGAFVIMPFAALHSTLTPPGPVPVNQVLLSGTGIDHARLSALMADMVQGGQATVRLDILSALATAPLQHGTFLLYELALWAAAGLGLLVMLLELALGAAERESSLARLATMGLGEGQRARLVALEVLPAVFAAAVAGAACAVALPRVVAPGIDLSVFTGSVFPGSGAAVTLAPNTASVALPLAGLAVLAAASLAIEIRTGRRRGVTASLRMGE
jgi:putative ABC transport system permease protein